MNPTITAKTTIKELAAYVSQALESAGIMATLSGGAAVSLYTNNRYQSHDLDFVTAERRQQLLAAVAPLGFVLARDQRHFTHADTELFLEFPAAPLGFGNRSVRHEDIPKLETPWGPLRIITPTQCVMDRLAAWWHWHDRPSWDQAVWVAASQTVDFDDLLRFAKEEGAPLADIPKLRQQAEEERTKNQEP